MMAAARSLRHSTRAGRLQRQLSEAFHACHGCVQAPRLQSLLSLALSRCR